MEAEPWAGLGAVAPNEDLVRRVGKQWRPDASFTGGGGGCGCHGSHRSEFCVAFDCEGVQLIHSLLAEERFEVLMRQIELVLEQAIHRINEHGCCRRVDGITQDGTLRCIQRCVDRSY